MSEHLHNLIFGVATAFLLPAFGFVLGMVFSKLVGGWRDGKIRKWWTSFAWYCPTYSLGLWL